jgi:uncharacterized protein (DUF4415 family)
MRKRTPLVDSAGEVRELTAEDMARFRPAAEVMSPELLAGLAALRKRRGERGVQKRPVKVSTTIRFDADVLAALKASGRGWQTRVNDVVKDWIKKDAPA